MKTPMTDRYEQDLKDPAVTALLRAAFADDPALEEAPGRSERIMRHVMASGVRPVWQRARWAPLGWAFGSLATAAAVLVLLLRTMTPPTEQVVKDPVPPKSAPKLVQKTPDLPKEERIIAKTPPISTTKEQPRTAWHNPAPKPVVKQPTPAANEPAVVAKVETPAHTAATLYSAGASASDAGDYETAFAAYQASYETSPTPEAMLASAEVLERINQEYLTPEG